MTVSTDRRITFIDLLYQLQLSCWATLNESSRNQNLDLAERLLPELSDPQRRQIYAFLQVIQMEFPDPKIEQLIQC